VSVLGSVSNFSQTVSILGFTILTLMLFIQLFAGEEGGISIYYANILAKHQ